MAPTLFSKLAEETLASVAAEQPKAAASSQAAGDPLSAIYEAAQARGINPEHLLGLAKLETQAGQKTVKGGGADTLNLFNIKDFNGGGTRALDKAEGSRDAYRQYASYRESVDDLINLFERKYPGALAAKSPEEFAQALKKGGYATDPAYADKLTRTIRSQQGGARPAEPAQVWDQGARYVPMDLLLPGGAPAPSSSQGGDNWLSRGWEKAKSSAGLTASLAGESPEQTAERVAAADKYNQANRGSKEKRELGEAWERGDGILGGLQEVGGEIAKDYREGGGFAGGMVATARNAKALAEGTVEQLPNSVFPMLGMGAGALAGSTVGPLGTAAGGIAGGAVGNTMVEGGGMLLEALQKAGINPQDKQAVAEFVAQNGDRLLGQAAIKGGVISAVDMATLKLGSKLLSGPADAAVSKALTELGIDTANKAAVKEALAKPAIKAAVQAKVAVDPAFQAASKGMQKVARNVGAASMEPGGEFAGEFAGTGLATGDWDTKNAALEAFSSVGQSAGTFAGQKAWQAAKASGGIVSRAGMAANSGGSVIQKAAGGQKPAVGQQRAAQAGSAGNPTSVPNAAAAAQPVSPIQASAQQAIDQALAQDIARRRAAGEDVGDEGVTEDDVEPASGGSANPFAGLFDTDEVYGSWSNTRDGSDRDTMRSQIAGAFNLYSKADLSTYDPASLKQELANSFKWFRAATPQQQADGVAAIFAAAGQPQQQPGAPAAPAATTPAGQGAPANPSTSAAADADRDPMLDQAIDFIRQGGRPSVSAVQRNFKIGYNRAAKMLESMEQEGHVGSLQPDGSRKRIDPAAKQPQQQPAEAGFSSPEPDDMGEQGQVGKTLAEMDEAELQARLSYITDQAKTNGGWNSMLSSARRQVQQEIDSRPKPAPEQQQAPAPMPQAQANPQPTTMGTRVDAAAGPGFTADGIMGMLPAAPEAKKATPKLQNVDELATEGFDQITRQDGKSFFVNTGTGEQVELDSPAQIARARARIQAKQRLQGMRRAGQQEASPVEKPETEQADVQQAPEFTTLKDVYGTTVTVKTADLNGDSELLRMFTKDGKPVGNRIHRENLDQTGEKRAEQAKENADNPFFDVITTKNGGTFAAEGAAERELNKRGMGETHEIVPASMVSPDATGFVIRKKQAPAETPVASTLAGEPINDEWTAFSDQSGTLGIPRAEMPQIKAEHRGAMVNYLKARGIDGQQETIPSAAIKPTQAEFSPAKVRKAMDYQGGNRSIIVSADGHVVDGHHQWLAAREKGEPIQAIRLDQNIGDVLATLKDMPSAQPDAPAIDTSPTAKWRKSWGDAKKVAESLGLLVKDGKRNLKLTELVPAIEAKLKKREKPQDQAPVEAAAETLAASDPAQAAEAVSAESAYTAAAEDGGGLQQGREGYDTPIEVDATALKSIIEQTRGEPLVDKPAKLQAWRDGTAKTDPKKYPIELAITPAGRLDVNDGRHRIALAAERGEKVVAFIDGKDAQQAQDLVALTETTPDQRRRSTLEREIATGTTNNGGVIAKLRPSAIEKRRQELAAMGDAGRLANQEAAVSESPDDLITAPDGSMDYGEITPEMSKVMRRQAGKIRLTRGVQNANGSGYGLAHIEANHGDQIRGLGYGSVQEFIKDIASNFEEIWKASGTQLLVTSKNGRKDVMFIQLDITPEGDHYRVNSAFPVRQRDYETRKGMKLLWPGSELQAKTTGQPSAFAAGNADQSSGAGPNATAQSVSSISTSLDVAQVPSSLQADPAMTAIFDQLNGRTERTREQGAKAAASNPQADRIQLVQDKFHDILLGLMDAGQLEVNGSKTVTEDNKSCL